MDKIIPQDPIINESGVKADNFCDPQYEDCFSSPDDAEQEAGEYAVQQDNYITLWWGLMAIVNLIIPMVYYYVGYRGSY